MGKHITGGNEPEDERRERERRAALREALSHWATGVTILAVREGDHGRVHGLTVSAFMPVSVDPPLVLCGLGSNASALPYLEPGVRYAISILSGEQRALASRYADIFPVGPSPFATEGAPRVRGSAASLVCEVDEMLARGDHTLVIGTVLEAESEDAGPALAYFRRAYRVIG